jgi:hypothetical protein
MSSLRVLVIDDDARKEAARVIGYAEANHYSPERAEQVPGNNPNFVAEFGTFRAVFTYTQVCVGCLYRHLSISIPGLGYPHPAAVFMIAELFGFTGWDGKTIDAAPDGWILEIHQEEDCIVLAQLCDPTELRGRYVQ